MDYYFIVSLLIIPVLGFQFVRSVRKSISHSEFSNLDLFILALSLLVLGYSGSFLAGRIGKSDFAVNFPLTFKWYGAFLLYVLTHQLITCVWRGRIEVIQQIGNKLVITICLTFIFGKVGCFLEAHRGCSGTFTDLPWGCQYLFSDTPFSQAVHPLQIYDILFNLALLVGFSLKLRENTNYDGLQTYFLLFAGYSVLTSYLSVSTYFVYGISLRVWVYSSVFILLLVQRFGRFLNKFFVKTIKLFIV